MISYTKNFLNNKTIHFVYFLYVFDFSFFVEFSFLCSYGAFLVGLGFVDQRARDVVLLGDAFVCLVTKNHKIWKFTNSTKNINV